MSENATPSPTPVETTEVAPPVEQDAPTVEAPAASEEQASGGQPAAAEPESSSDGPFYAQI